MPARVSPIRAFVVGLALLLMTAMPAAAGPFSSLVVFGDSLSDVGNIDNVTPFFFKYPGRYYYQGRFSNGPVWVEALATGLGLPAIAASTDGGNDFAYGGAQTAGTDGFFGAYVSDVNEQVTQYLSTRTVDPSGLYLVFAGANDLVGGQTNVNLPVNQLTSDIGRLIAAGARQFLIPNLPPLGYTPKFNVNSTTLAQYNMRSANFNTALASALDNLAAGNAALTFHRFDVFGLFGQALANPAAFGLTNVIDPAAPGLEPGDSSYNTTLIVAEPNKYLFWDDLHPTTAVHSILAAHALEVLLPLAGDYNGDDIVDAADYTVWRNSLGDEGLHLAADGNGDRMITRLDYDIWKMHYGETRPFGIAATETVAAPEPGSIGLTIIALALASILSRVPLALPVFHLLPACGSNHPKAFHHTERKPASHSNVLARFGAIRKSAGMASGTRRRRSNRHLVRRSSAAHWHG